MSHLFVFQDYQELGIPNTTNMLDGTFSDLKNKLRKTVVNICVVYLKYISCLCSDQKKFSMEYQEILLSAKMLSTTDRARLISELLGHFQEDYTIFILN